MRRLGGLADDRSRGQSPSTRVGQINELVTMRLEDAPMAATGLVADLYGSAQRACRDPGRANLAQVTSETTPDEQAKLSSVLVFIERVIAVVGHYHNSPRKATKTLPSVHGRIPALASTYISPRPGRLECSRRRSEPFARLLSQGYRAWSLASFSPPR